MNKLFGTDGVRGVANSELTCELSMRIGRAAAIVLKESGCRRFLIGSDTRASSDMIVGALSSGISSVGCDSVICGVLPTPAMAYLVRKYDDAAAIMVSASHNPSEYNGIKIFGSNGVKIADEIEDKIEEIVFDKSKIFRENCNTGRIINDRNAIFDYTNYLKNTLDVDLNSMKIALDLANGSAAATAGLIFGELGADVTYLSSSPNGRNINENCGSTHLENLKKTVCEGGFDVGFAFDGDADRCLCIDENGEEIDGDFVLAICATDLKKRGKLKGDTVVGTVMSNFGLIKFCENSAINFVATKVGDRYVLEHMQNGGFVLGGEQSGHIIFSEFATTGDGQLTALQILSVMKRSKKSLSDLALVMRKYPQVLLGITADNLGKTKFSSSKDIAAFIDEKQKELSGNGRIVVRPSGTEPLIRVMVEGGDFDEISRIASEIAGKIRVSIG